MHHTLVARLAALPVLLLLAAGPALAGSTTISGNVTTERVPDDFDATKSTDWGLGVSHTFDNSVIVAVNGKYYDTANTSNYKVNLDTSLGYTHNFGAFSLTGMAGVGQHFIESDDSSSFPYYFFSFAADIPITKQFTWTAVKLRYRNAFDTDNDYNTPEVATGISFWATEHTAVTLFIERDWTDGDVAYNGIELGFKHKF
ncbi:hypothetical protein [Ancylobacter radicis]|uniref:Porin family protein n=1 Tax=Ancylobacter radicis TaxID=2836179 RepID=A0ABS5R820_9HYPH|nr:hypothetical protein [Ancylobacter radicis]MBS9477816.1 hypothetical protein [Ancylobacter radicis]